MAGFFGGLLGSYVAPAGAYELISTTVLGSATASVTFDVSSLSATYKHLQIRYTARSSNSGNTQRVIGMQFNGDTATNYVNHELNGNGSVVSSTAETAVARLLVGYYAGSTATANVFGAGVIDILDAFSSSKNKTIRSLSGTYNSAGTIALQSGMRISTSALTSVLLKDAATYTFAAGSRFSLYGIRG